MLTLLDLAISEIDFRKCVKNEEDAWKLKFKGWSIESKPRIVQFWVKLNKENVPNEYIDSLILDYRKHWKNVKVEWVEDRYTTLMIMLDNIDD